MKYNINTIQIIFKSIVYPTTILVVVEKLKYGVPILDDFQSIFKPFDIIQDRTKFRLNLKNGSNIKLVRPIGIDFQGVSFNHIFYNVETIDEFMEFIRYHINSDAQVIKL